MLSKKFQYAIHALQYLAEHALMQPVSIQEISDCKRIPKKFLEGILLELRNANIVSSKRGKEGGYYMSRSPEDINLVDILLATDDLLEILPCLEEDCRNCATCRNETYCQIKNSFSCLRQELIEFLRKKTLAEITREIVSVPIQSASTAKNKYRP